MHASRKRIRDRVVEIEHHRSEARGRSPAASYRESVGHNFPAHPAKRHAHPLTASRPSHDNDASTERQRRWLTGGNTTTEVSFGHDSGVEKAIAELAADREHGATDLAREALEILESAAVAFPEEGLGANLDGVGVLIVLSRPNMASVKNVVSRALADGPLIHPGQAKRAFARARSWLDYAAKATIEETASMIPPGAIIVTCSYSATVLEACVSASNAGKEIKVVALTSKVGDIAYGERMAEALIAQGVDAEVYPDGVSIEGLGEVTMALIGADRVSPDGSATNGVPSLLLAEHSRGIIPFYVAAETFQLDDSELVEDGFEPVPPGLITGYVTDRGVVQPDQVWKLRGTT